MHLYDNWNNLSKPTRKRSLKHVLVFVQNPETTGALLSGSVSTRHNASKLLLRVQEDTERQNKVHVQESLQSLGLAHMPVLSCTLRALFTQYGMRLTVTRGTVALLQKDSR